MHTYVLNTYPVRAGRLATIDDAFLLGVFPSLAAADEAYDRWADSQEGQSVKHPYDNMNLPLLPLIAKTRVGRIDCHGVQHDDGGQFLRNVPALDDAAQTGEPVYVGQEETFFLEEQVLTASGVERYAEELSEEGLRIEPEDILRGCIQVDEALLAALRIPEHGGEAHD